MRYAVFWTTPTTVNKKVRSYRLTAQDDSWSPLLQFNDLVAKTYQQNLSILMTTGSGLSEILHQYSPSKSSRSRLFTYERFGSRHGHAGDEPSRNLPY